MVDQTSKIPYHFLGTKDIRSFSV